MRFRTGFTTVATILVLTATTRAADKKSPKGEQQPSQLVWPLPPDPPRVRWVREYADLDQVKGKSAKQSWADRVAGKKKSDERNRLIRPYGIAVDSKGRIFVADAASHAVFMLDGAQRRFEKWGGNSGASMALPVGVAVDSSGRLFVADSALHTILCLDQDGRVLGQFGTTQLQRPGGIAIDSERHRLYVPDAKASRIAVFSTQKFAFERYIGSPSTPGKREPGKFAAPTNVAVDRKGQLYVTDTWNHRVQVFDPNGRFVRAWGEHGVRPGEFVRPKGIAIDSEGHVYVADAEFNNIQIFNPDGQVLLAVGSIGPAPGQFTLLTGLCIDSEDRIYTTEQYTGRIQIFKYLPNIPAKEVAVKKP